MRKLISILLFVFFISGSMTYAAPFPDLPADHWATEAVKVLAEKGMVEGYPNGTFRGQRAATRYEVAMVVARLLAYLEKRPQVSKEDLETIKNLVNEFKDELDAMGVRLKNVEDLLASLQKRVTELERVKFSGSFASRFSTNLVSTCPLCTLMPLPFDGTAMGVRLPMGDQNLAWNRVAVHNPDRENLTANAGQLWSGQLWEVEGAPLGKAYDVYPTRSGTELTDTGYLKVQAKLSDDYDAGGLVAFYNNVGQLGMGNVYGVLAPTINNPFQAGQTPLQATLFGSNLNTNLNQVFVSNNKQKFNAVIGDWRPAFMLDHVLQGIPNFSLFGPDYLPFYGGQVFGQVQAGNRLSGLQYEVAGGRLSVNNPGLPTGGGAGTTYQNYILAGALGYSWKELTPMLGELTAVGNYVRAINDNATAGAGAFGGVANPGLWASSPFPTQIGGLNGGANFAGNAFTANGVGPQIENLYGLELRAKFAGDWKWLNAFLKYGGSSYIASRTAFTPSANGNLYAGGLAATSGRFSGRGEYLYVDSFYDPFVAQVPILTANFTGALVSPVTWLGFPYPVSYGPLYTTSIGTLSGNGSTTFNSTTGGAGDVFYNLHDVRQYPQNRTGFRGNLVWNYGGGKVGGNFEYLQQVRVSSYPALLNPGFSEPLFMTLQNPAVGVGAATVQQASSVTLVPTRGFTRVWSLLADYTFPSKNVTLDGVFTDSRIKRFEPDFNNVNLHLFHFRAGVTYRPWDKWSLMGGYAQFSSVDNGRYLQPDSNQLGPGVVVFANANGFAGNTTIGGGGGIPPNYLWRQRGPYVGGDYEFVKGMDVWALFRYYAMAENTLRGYSGFNGTQLQSGLRFTF